MTVADPHGRPRDFIRSCYSSWMRVPDHEQPIRVRWYKIADPPPGSYPMGGFSSSDWDEDPKSYDPELGEQSTRRNPFTDWEDCGGPPWPGYFGCPLTATPAYREYTVDISGCVPAFPDTTTEHVYIVFERLPCFWDNGFSHFPDEEEIQFTVQPGGLLAGSITWIEFAPPFRVAFVETGTDEPAAMDRPFRVYIRPGGTGWASLPEYITYIPRPWPRNQPLIANTGKKIITSGKLRILTVP